MPYPSNYQKDLSSLNQNFASYSKIYLTIFNKLFVKAIIIQTISVIIIFQLLNSIGSINNLSSKISNHIFFNQSLHSIKIKKIII